MHTLSSRSTAKFWKTKKQSVRGQAFKGSAPDSIYKKWRDTMAEQKIKSEILPNGVRIVYEKLSHVSTVAIGIWVQSGARHEPKELCGISHFIEHMVFKGTNERSARDIAEQMDGIGGQINAFTSNECTCFYARSLDTHFYLAADVLCDIFFGSKFADADIRSERNVIYEEIGMYEDSPEDLAVDRLNEAVFRGSSLGRPILGTKKTLRTFNSQILRNYRDTHYTSEGIIVSVAGNYSEDQLKALKERFSKLPHSQRIYTPEAKYNRAVTLRRKPIEQNHLCIAFPMPGYSNDDRFAIQLLSSILGGGMSSRLFQCVREEAGLCYSIASFTGTTAEQGLFCINTALGRETESEAIDLIMEEIDSICQSGVEDLELFRAREQLKANIMMGMENTNARMNNLAQNMLRYNRIITPDETMQRIDAVTKEDILACARNVLDSKKMSFSGVGELKSADWYKRRFNLL